MQPIRNISSIDEEHAKTEYSDKSKADGSASDEQSNATKNDIDTEKELLLSNISDSESYFSIFEDSNYYPKPSKHVIELKKLLNSDNTIDDSDCSIVKSTVVGIIIQFSNPIDAIKYQQFQDFFISYRVFLDPIKLLNIITCRLKWCIVKIAEIIRQKKHDFLQDDQNNKDKKFTCKIEEIEIILVRTFVLLRHWISNYFIQDFLNNHHLSALFISFINSFNSNNIIKRKIIVNCLNSLKKCWIDQYNQCFDKKEYQIDTNKINNRSSSNSGAREMDWLNFMIPIGRFQKTDTNGQQITDTKRLSFYALQSSANPAFRNQSLLSVYGTQNNFQIPHMNDENSTSALEKKQNILYPQNNNFSYKNNNQNKRTQSRNLTQNTITDREESRGHSTGGSLNSSIINNLIDVKNATLLKTYNIKYPDSSNIDRIEPLTPSKTLQFTISVDDLSKENITTASNGDDQNVSKKRDSIFSLLNKWQTNDPNESDTFQSGSQKEMKKFVKYVFSIGTIGPNNMNDGFHDDNEEFFASSAQKFDVLGARSIDQLQYLINMENQLFDQLKGSRAGSNTDINMTDDSHDLSSTAKSINGMDNLNMYQKVTSIANTVLSSAKKNQMSLKMDILTNNLINSSSLNATIPTPFQSPVSTSFNLDTQQKNLKMSPFLRSIDRKNTYVHKRVSSHFMMNLETPSKVNNIHKTFTHLDLKPLRSAKSADSLRGSNKSKSSAINGGNSTVQSKSQNGNEERRNVTNLESDHFSHSTSNVETENNSNISHSLSLSNEFNLMNESNHKFEFGKTIENHFLKSSLPGIPTNTNNLNMQVHKQGLLPSGLLPKASNSYLNKQPRALNSGRISISTPSFSNEDSQVSSKRNSNTDLKKREVSNEPLRAHKKTRSVGTPAGMNTNRFDINKNPMRHHSFFSNDIRITRNKNSQVPYDVDGFSDNPSFVSKDEIFQKQFVELERLQKKISHMSLKEKSGDVSNTSVRIHALAHNRDEMENDTPLINGSDGNFNSANILPQNFSRKYFMDGDGHSDSISESNIPTLCKISPSMPDAPYFKALPPIAIPAHKSEEASLGTPKSFHSNVSAVSVDTNMLLKSSNVENVPYGSSSVSRKDNRNSTSRGYANANTDRSKNFRSSMHSGEQSPRKSTIAKTVQPTQASMFLNGQPNIKHISSYVSDSDNELEFSLEDSYVDSINYIDGMDATTKKKRNTFSQVETKLDLRKQFQEQHQQNYVQDDDNESHNTTNPFNAIRSSFMVYDGKQNDNILGGSSNKETQLYGVVVDDEYNNSFKHNYHQNRVSNGSSLDFSSIRSSPINVNNGNEKKRNSKIHSSAVSSRELQSPLSNLHDSRYDSDSVESRSLSKSKPLSKAVSLDNPNNPYFIVTSESPDEHLLETGLNQQKLQADKDSSNGQESLSESRFSRSSPNANKMEFLRQKFLSQRFSTTSDISDYTNKDDTELSRDITLEPAEQQDVGKRSHSLQSDPNIIQLASLPDKSFQGDDPVEVAMRKLEGSYKTNNISPVKLENSEESFDSSPGIDMDEQSDLSQKHSSKHKKNDKKRQTVLIESRRNTRLFNMYSNEAESKSKLGQERAVADQEDNSGIDIPSANEQISELLQYYVLTDEKLLLGNSDEHIPFILMYHSEDVAAQMTLIERDILNEVDWMDLLELNMKDNLPNFTTWLEVLFQNDKLSGIDLSIGRFNLSVDWVISEIVLCKNIKLKRNTIQKFIHISEHCIKLQNFNTVMQIVLALSSPIVQSYTQSWRLIDPGDLLKWAELQKLFSVDNNYYEVREFMNEMDPIMGCLPFLVLYLGDLISLKEISNHFHSNTHIINYSKFDNMVSIIKSFIQRVQWGTEFYNIDVNPQLLSKCLYIGCLSSAEMDLALESA